MHDIKNGIRILRQRWPDVVGSAKESPIFLFAAGWRSGSTLLQRMFFPDRYLWGEPFGHAELIDQLSYTFGCVTHDWPNRKAFPRERSRETLAGEPIANLYPEIQTLVDGQLALFETSFAQPARRQGAIGWGMKFVRCDLEHAHYLKFLFPYAKFLFLIRNPYDAFRSWAARRDQGRTWYKRWPNEPVTTELFAQHWRRLAESFFERSHEVDGHLQRYEDLLAGSWQDTESYLGFSLNREAAGVINNVAGIPANESITATDRETLGSILGDAALRMGYRDGSTEHSPSITAIASQREAGPTDHES